MEDLFRKALEVHVSRGDRLNTTDFVYYIKSGVAGQYAMNKGTQKLLFAFKAGEVFPMSSSLMSNSSGRKYLFKSLSKCKLLKLPVEEYNALANNSNNAKLMLDCALQVMQHQIERIDNLQEEQIMQRLLERLLYIAFRFGSRKGDAVIIDVPMSHVDLANSINTSRETVNRYMKNLEQLKVITLRKQIIRINSLAEIHKLLEPEASTEEIGHKFAKGLATASIVASTILISLNSVSTTIGPV